MSHAWGKQQQQQEQQHTLLEAWGRTQPCVAPIGHAARTRTPAHLRAAGSFNARSCMHGCAGARMQACKHRRLRSSRPVPTHVRTPISQPHLRH